MFVKYSRGELASRRKQSLIVVAGMAVAVGLLIVVNAVSSGVQSAQQQVLGSVYGVGTDITVAMAPQEGQRGPGRFLFGAEDGAADEDGTRSLATSQLLPQFGSPTVEQALSDEVLASEHVAAASASLALTNTTFSGEIPDFSQGPPQSRGGADGEGGSSFEVTTFSVAGVDLSAPAIGPLSGIEVTEGRALAMSDSGEPVVVVDTVYAATEGLAVGDSIALAGTETTVVGVVESATGEGVSTGTDVYASLVTAQTLSGLDGLVSDIYVQVDSAANVDEAKADIAGAIPGATVSSESDLADSVSGSLSSASDLINRLGTWVSWAMLIAAFAVAALFTVSGVTRRTREFGTLKAIGWRDSRVVRQVAGESVVQGFMGGVAGIALGLLGVIAINWADITFSASAGPDLPEPVRSGGPFGALVEAVTAPVVDVVLVATTDAAILVAGLVLAVLGGLIAGLIGGRRAAALRPAEALRSVA